MYQLPYYAVIFTSYRTDIEEGYAETAQRMIELAKQQPGFLGVDGARQEVGITISYWESEEAIRNWKRNSEHLFAQQQGREKWYSHYNTRVCRVEREYEYHSKPQEE
ncbi:MAG: antibiotic biosynthesis monooxygenase [Candidatus Kapaibacterium sp.]